MKLSRLMEQHQKFKDQGLPTSFGDGYLMAHNRIFRKIREALLAAGFRLDPERDEAYETFPLLQLERLLKARTLPYANNLAGFEHLTPRELEILTWDDLEGNLKKNFVFHEGTHAVVRTLAEKHLPSFRPGPDVESQRLFALRMLLEESCANTFELLGVIDAQDAVHRAFYELNSYVCEFESRTHLKKAWDDLGGKTLIKFMVLSYLHSNFLRETIEDRDFQKMVKLATDQNLDSKQLKTLRALSKIAFNLSERFRVQTTDFHLRLAGTTLPLDDILDLDFIKTLDQMKGAHGFLKAIGELAPN